jgi:protein-S-isoprenylcysteine O-methyltransferase Ste14
VSTLSNIPTLPLILVLSLIGFGGYLALDVVGLRQQALPRVALILISSLALAAAFTLAVSTGDPLGWPLWLKGPGFVIGALGGLLTIYSTLIEIPLLSMRQKAGSTQPAGLVRHGTYALCRHPGFMWLVLYLVGLVCVVDRTSTLLMALWWVTLELGVVLIQDHLIFPRLFTMYELYRRLTPMIIPTPNSVREAILSIRTGSHE